MRTTLHSEIRKERCNQAALGLYNASIASGNNGGNSEDENANLEKDPVSVKDIFNDISSINTTTNTISSLGTYASALHIQVSERLINELREIVDKDSVAYKILTSDNNLSLRRGYSFTDKQRWAIAYELEKNSKYVNKIGREKFLNRQKSERKANESKAKLSANKSASQSVLDHIKSNKGKLGDYYKWLNTSGNPFRKQKFNKKYTMESANAFLNKKST